MPSVVAGAVTFLKTVGLMVGGLGISGGTALAIGAATVVAGAVVAKKLIDNIYGIPSLDGDRSRQATVRGTVEPQKLIYGQSLVSGPISFVGVAGTENRDLYHVIVLAGHPCTAITDIHFDDMVIANGAINAAGNVIAGTFGPQDGTTICVVRKKLGDQTTTDAVLDAAFGTINSNEHIGTNLTYIVTKFTLTDESQEVWDKYLPQDIKAVVKGKKIYDPRQDNTSTYYDASVGVATQRATNSATWEWSENPVWCLVDYMRDDTFGMSINISKIDLAKAVTAADQCDASVSIPSGSEKRFTCNGVLFGTVSHKANINKLLSAMNGMLTYTNGKFVIRAGAFEAVGTGLSLTDDHLAGPVKLKTSFERNERFNTITGTFIDPSNNYKQIEFPRVQITSALTRDNNEELREELKLNMTNSFYMAQRISHKLIQQSDLQKVLTFPTNLAGINIAVGDRVSVTLSEFNYTNKTFVCLGWNLSESGAGGVNLILREDDSASYADMASGSYSTVTASGGIAEGFFGVPDPSGLSATALVEGIELDWVNPVNMTHIIAIEVFASATSAWSGAQKVGETIGTQFIHDASNGVDPIADGDERYYWVRARRFPTGEGTDAVSDRNPDSDTSTVNATRGALGALANLDSVGDAQIDDNAVGTDQIADDAVTSTQIADGAVDISAFASGIQPVQVVSSLPGSASEGDIAYLTTDNKLYRYDGSAWTLAVDGADVTSGTLPANAIVANSLTAGQIAAGAISTDELAANSVNADKIQVNSITANKISGDISEVFNLGVFIYPQHTVTSSKTTACEFTVPAPDSAIKKYASLVGRFKYAPSADLNDCVLRLQFERESTGTSSGTSIGTVQGSGSITPYFHYVEVSGNKSTVIDTFGGLANAQTSPSTIVTPAAVEYQSTTDRTRIIYGNASSGTPSFTSGTIYYNEDRWLSTGTWLVDASGQQFYPIPAIGLATSYTMPLNQALANSSTEENYRLRVDHLNVTTGTLKLTSLQTQVILNT
ncbi:phage tail protein [bacterium]|nr:phage tail protein [bacterium]